VPREHALFTRDDGVIQLHLAPNMSGRIATGEKVTMIEGERTLALGTGARGKLQLGDVTILFQDVATPPLAPRPRLPASIRGTFSDRIDRRLAVIVGASLVAHIAIAAWAWSEDIDTGVLGQPSLSEYRPQTIDVTLPDHVDRVDPTTNVGPKPAVAPPVAPQHRIVPEHTRNDPKQLIEDASRMASILTGDDGTHGFGGMAQRTPGADLNRQIDDARNRTITIGENGHTSRIDDRAHIGTGQDLPAIHDPTPMDHVQVTHSGERPGRIVIKPLPGGGDPTTLTPQAVLDKINSAYIAGLQRCYRLGQNEDASLEGKIALELTVDAHGRVADHSANGLTPKVDTCVASFMTTWHFGIPRDKAGEATEASFKISLLLERG
jgi:hypothetical protein